jgi:predicted dehydrogenase
MPTYEAPVRIAFAGLSHGHVNWWFRRQLRGDVQLAGVYEPDAALAALYVDQHGLDPALVYSGLDDMLAAVKPEGVMAFGTTAEHLDVTRHCAPRGVHVMVEKPLALSSAQAAEMAALAAQHCVHVLTNYETTWYASTHESHRLACDERAIGMIRKIVVHDGHWGPSAIGCAPHFLNWLRDPERNGGGAIMDFGCYGASLITWLMRGAAPLSVTAVTQQQQPDTYPNVDDDATIIVTYPGAQGIIQGSWNWPWHRKDMEIYGSTGSIIAPDRATVRVRGQLNAPEETRVLPPRPDPHDDPFALFAAVIRGAVTLPADDLYGLDNNLTAMRILDAARDAARSGMTVRLASGG